MTRDLRTEISPEQLAVALVGAWKMGIPPDTPEILKIVCDKSRYPGFRHAGGRVLMGILDDHAKQREKVDD